MNQRDRLLPHEDVRSLQHYQERGLIRQDVNPETLARILFCINAGYQKFGFKTPCF
jgi:hypothetical protein